MTTLTSNMHYGATNLLSYLELPQFDNSISMEAAIKSLEDVFNKVEELKPRTEELKSSLASSPLAFLLKSISLVKMSMDFNKEAFNIIEKLCDIPTDSIKQLELALTKENDEKKKHQQELENVSTQLTEAQHEISEKSSQITFYTQKLNSLEKDVAMQKSISQHQMTLYTTKINKYQKEIDTQKFENINQEKIIHDLNQQIERLGHGLELQKRQEEEINNLKQEMSYQKALFNEEVQYQRQQIDNRNREIKDQKQAVNELKQEIQKLTTFNTELPVSQTSIPYTFIETKSLTRLSQNGWTIKTRHSDKIDSLQEIACAGVLGAHGVGKSWLLNQLSNGQIPFGLNNLPDTLSFFYSSFGKSSIGVLESTGWNDPLLFNDEQLSLMKNSQYSSSNRELQQHYRLAWEEKMILNDLKRRFIVDNTELLILVMNSLTEKDQEMIHKIARQINEINQSAAANSANFSTRQLLLVHNFKDLTTRRQVEERIQTLKMFFALKELAIFTTETQGEATQTNINKVMYKDEFDMVHLILAADNFEAGKYYNSRALKYIQNHMLMARVLPFNFAQSFVDFSNDYFKSMFGHEFKLRLSDHALKIVCNNEIKQHQIMLSEMWNNPFVFEKFKPKYFKRSTLDEDSQTVKIEVDIEVLNSQLAPGKISEEKGVSYLIIEGEKKNLLQEESQDCQGTSETGRFTLRVDLVRNLQYVKHTKETPQDGIMRYTFEFKKEMKKFTAL